MEHDCGGVETNNYTASPERHRLKLNAILVQQLDACDSGGKIVDLDHCDRRLVDCDTGLHKSYPFCGIPIDGFDAALETAPELHPGNETRENRSRNR